MQYQLEFSLIPVMYNTKFVIFCIDEQSYVNNLEHFNFAIRKRHATDYCDNGVKKINLTIKPTSLILITFSLN